MAITEKVVVGFTTKNEQIAWQAINVADEAVSQVPDGWNGTSDPSKVGYPNPEPYTGDPSVNLYTVPVSVGTVYGYEPPSLIIGTFSDGSGGGRVSFSTMLASEDAYTP